MASLGEEHSLLSFKDADSLTKYLEVSVDTLYCVDLEQWVPCTVPGCSYPALLCNGSTDNT